MHIPDGYLSPQTYVPLWGVMVLVWARASTALKRTVSAANLPLLAIGAAFSFVIMMFNVPIPGATTGHAVGGALVAILLGPWAAAVAISVALTIQALIFGDGGITAIAANCLTMAVIGPFVAWWVYRAAAGASVPGAARRVWAGGIAAYASLNASALATAVLFGIQPMIARTATGQPLYAPYPLAIAVPAMMIEHLLLFGFVEAVVTAAAVRWFQASDPALLELAAFGGRAGVGPASAPPSGQAPGAAFAQAAKPAPPTSTERPAATGALPAPAGAEARRSRRLWTAVAVLAILSPLGLWLPSAFGGGAAWGEWGSDELKGLLGFVPAGLARLENAWSAAFPDYAVAGLQGPLGEAVGYIFSAALGIGVIAGVAWALTRVLGPRSPRPAAHSGDTG